MFDTCEELSPRIPERVGETICKKSLVQTAMKTRRGRSVSDGVKAATGNVPDKPILFVKVKITLFSAKRKSCFAQ
jgi:hypothetical protein